MRHAALWKRAILPLATATLAALPATAQEPARDHVAELKRCEAIGDAAVKLACLESAAGALVGAVERGDLRLVNREQRERTRRGLFGFSLGNIFGGGDDKPGEAAEAEMKTLTSTITAVRQIDRKTWQLRIADGNALWQINEAPARFIPPRVGETVEFERAALGSYWVRIGKQLGVKGKRVG